MSRHLDDEDAAFDRFREENEAEWDFILGRGPDPNAPQPKPEAAR